MFTNKNYFSPICLSVLTALFLSACGSSGSGSSDDSEAADDSTSIIEINEVQQQEQLESEQAINLIKEYANGETNIAPVLSDYIDAGVSGLSSRALNELNDEVSGATPEEVDTVSELDTLVASLETTNSIPQISNATIDNYLTVINNARSVARNCGSNGNFPAADALTWNNQLYSAAYEHSQDLSESDTFDHNGSNTISDWTGYPEGLASTFDQRIEAYGSSWSRLSENISGGTIRDTAQEAVDSWLASDGHCKNIMNTDFTQVGMAVSYNPDSVLKYYWTQDFGTPR